MLLTAGVGLISVGVAGNYILGLKAESSSNVAGWSPQTLEDDGPIMTSLYEGSNTKSFGVDSFWFGCVLNTALSAVPVPTKCTISISGYRQFKRLAYHEVEFVPDNAVVASPKFVQLPKSFHGLTIVKFVILSSVNVKLTAAGIDNVVFTPQPK
jgi:hypothetical protein